MDVNWKSDTGGRQAEVPNIVTYNIYNTQTKFLHVRVDAGNDFLLFQNTFLFERTETRRKTYFKFPIKQQQQEQAVKERPRFSA
jgi:hypothetical protein